MGTTTRRLCSATWLLRHWTCSDSWFHLHRRRSPFSIGGCYGNAAENCCDMTHDECQKSRAAVMEYGAVSARVSELQRGEISFLFSRKLKAARKAAPASKRTPSAMFTCLFHAPRRHRGGLAVPRCYGGGLSRRNCSGSLGNSTRSSRMGGEKLEVAGKIYQGPTANRHVERRSAERAPRCAGGINHTGCKRFPPLVCLLCGPGSSAPRVHVKPGAPTVKPTI